MRGERVKAACGPSCKTQRPAGGRGKDGFVKAGLGVPSAPVPEVLKQDSGPYEARRPAGSCGACPSAAELPGLSHLLHPQRSPGPGGGSRMPGCHAAASRHRSPGVMKGNRWSPGRVPGASGDVLWIKRAGAGAGGPCLPSLRSHFPFTSL